EEGDQLRWVRRSKVEDSIIIGSRHGMAIHFRTNHEQLRPLGRATRGVRAMALRDGDELIGMDILPSQIVNNIAEADESESAEEIQLVAGQGPCVLVITMGGYGKRVPISQFRLQNRAGLGVLSTKFRKAKDKLAALRVVNEEDEL
ncbi:DNA gyrase C-terminal beta-propeller domain-containing protein, partial [Pediococcus acidilactici]|uniref:DNA gyrase C-terminal beta-propeller domain-containing protein n=1 Tax=Pediococcus acidilactici TaxID=1254 RepID=UPI00318D6366